VTKTRCRCAEMQQGTGILLLAIEGRVESNIEIMRIQELVYRRLLQEKALVTIWTRVATPECSSVRRGAHTEEPVPSP
jgi:hypothetical protein